MILSLIGIGVSYFAWKAAKSASEAALDAKKTIHIQSIIIELSEINSKLDNLEQNISFDKAREYIIQLNRKIARSTSLISSDLKMSSNVDSINSTLTLLQTSLDSVRPIGKAVIPSTSIYHALESNLRTLSIDIAKLIGLLENETITVI